MVDIVLPGILSSNDNVSQIGFGDMHLETILMKALFSADATITHRRRCTVL